ncbi:MAG: helix-turn-helix domain-containing protein [Phycisphaeraceae bacterium]|nr:helix-turn-helix domain-containing protein [Phycisphaeraceae bacterium]
MKLLLSVREAAQALAVSERTLWQMTKDGVISSIKVGTRSVRYPVTVVILLARTQLTSPEAGRRPHINLMKT